MSCTLVLGGVRSGKTALAERLITARSSGHAGGVLYLATAEAGDDEMRERIRRHRQQRPRHWRLLEIPLQLGQSLNELAGSRAAPCVLIDCMSLWVSNLLHAEPAALEREKAALLSALEHYPGAVIVVSNEAGLGLIGMDALSRRFADQLGWLNQDLAALSEQVVMSVAGLPLVLKGAPLPAL